MVYKCLDCNKDYSSYQSLWIHNKKFHNINVKNSVKNIVKNVKNSVKNVKNDNYICELCNKTFSCRQSKHEHKKNKTCQKDIKINELENKIILIKKEIDEYKKDNNEINTQNNIQLNDNKIINGNIINGTVNNTYIINPIGSENIDKLTFEDIKKIFRQHKNSLYHAIDFVNFNENIPENHNFYNSSLEGKYINVFNTETNTPEKKNKKDFFDKLLMSSLKIMNLLYEKVKDSVSPIKQQSLLKIIEELDKIAHLDNHKKIYATNVNQISYNKKNIVKKSWNEYTKNNNKPELIKDINYDSDTESKDSFYYLTEESEDEL
jgi:hypothetical protein